MDLSHIPVGANPPHEVNVIIEIPQGGVPVKYEVDKVSGQPAEAIDLIRGGIARAGQRG